MQAKTDLEINLQATANVYELEGLTAAEENY